MTTSLDAAQDPKHSPSEQCDCPNPSPGRPFHCAALPRTRVGTGQPADAAPDQQPGRTLRCPVFFAEWVEAYEAEFAAVDAESGAEVEHGRTLVAEIRGRASADGTLGGADSIAAPGDDWQSLIMRTPHAAQMILMITKWLEHDAQQRFVDAGTEESAPSTYHLHQLRRAATTLRRAADAYGNQLAVTYRTGAGE